VDGLLGYRYLQSNESLGLFGRTQSPTGAASFNGVPVPPEVVLVTTDSFRADTQFHGMQFGGRVEGRSGLITFTASGKAGIGANIETLRTDGVSQASGFGITKTTLGGVRVLPSNFGRSVNTEFAFMSELGADLGLQVTRHVSVHVGYNMLYWTNVLRPGNAIDPVVNRAQVPIDPTYNPAALGPRPTPVFHTSELLAHGLVVGVVVDW
jgi:hypothetical protein